MSSTVFNNGWPRLKSLVVQNRSTEPNYTDVIRQTGTWTLDIVDIFDRIWTRVVNHRQGNIVGDRTLLAL